MNIKFIKSSEKKKILGELQEQYGISKLPYLLIETGKEKIRAFSGHLSKEEILQLSKLINIEIIGLYLINKKDNNFRLSFDSLTLLKEQINKNIIKIDNEQLNSWIKGQDLEIKTQIGLVVLQYQDDFVGAGKSNGLKIFNYVPKERKIKSSGNKKIY